jgi:hypothetical protein
MFVFLFSCVLLLKKFSRIFNVKNEVWVLALYEDICFSDLAWFAADRFTVETN